jgi:GMP synthase-like glutamine amidotransferase
MLLGAGRMKAANRGGKREFVSWKDAGRARESSEKSLRNKFSFSCRDCLTPGLPTEHGLLRGKKPAKTGFSYCFTPCPLIKFSKRQSAHKIKCSPSKGPIMRAHYLQHVPFEGLGSIEPWLKRSGYEISRTPFFESTELPDMNAFGLLIVMGGPMSVNDESRFPWLLREKQFIRLAIEQRKPVLGVCLGAQLIANAMGARVYRNRFKEIGWFPVQGVPTDDRSVFSFPPAIHAFHWHGETFDLPPNAVRIARSEGCENQGFQLGSVAIALQFHLEMTPDAARDIMAHCRGELKPDKYVQSAAHLLSAAPENYQAINALMDDILAFLVQHGG